MSVMTDFKDVPRDKRVSKPYSFKQQQCPAATKTRYGSPLPEGMFSQCGLVVVPGSKRCWRHGGKGRHSIARAVRRQLAKWISP